MKINFTMKVLSEADLNFRAKSALQECLGAVPAVSVSISQKVSISPDKRPDFVVEVKLDDACVTVVAEVKKSGEPLYARNAIIQLKSYCQLDPTTVGLFIAPYISPETAKLCRGNDVGYLDLAGNCHLAFRGVYIHIEGKPNPAAHSRTLRSLYQPKAERVLRVLLKDPSASWRIQALASEAKVSVGQVFKVKKLLQEKEWVEETERGLSLAKPQDLLADWARQYRSIKNQAAQFYTLSNINSFEQTLSIGCRQRNIPCAFTSLAAAARYAPYANYQRTIAYLHYELPEVQELLGQTILQLTPVEGGANVTLLSPADDGVFYGATWQQDTSLASPIQTYLDLQSTGARGLEAAGVLLQTEIIPNW